MNRPRVTPGEYAATMAELGRVLEELEPTQEIARTAFEKVLPELEETQRIDTIPAGTWKVRAPIGTSGPCWVRAPHLSEAN